MKYDTDYLISLIKNRLSEKRYTHCIGVMKAAVRLADLYKADKEKALIAGLLHDYSKELTIDEQLKILNSSDIIFDKDFILSPKVWHGPCAAIELQKSGIISDDEILSSIFYHSTGNSDMSLLDKVIYIADLVSEERDYDDVREMRKIAYSDIDSAMVYALKFSLTSLIKKNRPICKYTIDAYNAFVLKEKESKEDI